MPSAQLGPLGLGSRLDWREGLPFMATARILLRELRRSDAPALHRVAHAPEIARHTWPVPPTLDAIEQFIEWSRTRRAEGRYAGFGVVPAGHDAVAGLFQLRALQPDFFRAELAFFLDRPLWGTGAFLDAARLVCEFGFTAIGVHRIEARSEVDNDRANAALQKLGATREGRLRASFVRGDAVIDQYLWSLVTGLDAAATADETRPARRLRLW